MRNAVEQRGWTLLSDEGDDETGEEDR